ncbi:hypothetical protein FGO68_gene3388 [Halteria grandinella]|uniref:Rhodanese domain-containing protein n=1 Tax=Halteria grandinella TaxID=5974 RepID=A0A8J8NJP4_HALGN|nr:hypothetical protein FGO68_gene3388 [Halteria grandinella]
MLAFRSHPDLKIFDCSVMDGALLSFHADHLPDASFIDLNYFRNMTNPYPFMLPGVQQFTDTMKLNGIKKSTRVVLYDKGNSYYATRVYWMLRTYGHENASVLNGGFPKWKAEMRRTESTEGFEQPIVDSEFEYAFKPELYRYFEQIVQLSKDIKAKDTTEQLTDARPKSSYDAGHIDEAINLWWQELQNADHTVKSPAEIWAIAQANGVDLTHPQTTSCQSGITATWLYASFQHAGNQNTAVYDGSYNEYSQRIKNVTHEHHHNQTSTFLY